MKKSNFIIAAAALCVSAAAAQGNFSLKGTLPDPSLNGKKIYIVNYDTNEKLDSATVKDNTFSFNVKTGTASLPAALMLNGRKSVTFILEPGNAVLSEDGAVRGTALNDKNEAIMVSLDSLYNDYRSNVKNLSKSGKPMNEIMAEAEQCRQSLSESVSAFLLKEFDANKDNAVGYGLFLQITDGMSIEEMDGLLSGSPEWMKNSNAVKTAMRKAENLEKTAPGKMFTDFSVKTSDGKTAKLSDYVGKGKYILADFFASWCGPCMREMPNLKSLHEKYAGKGFEIVGIAVWDDPADTKRCVGQQQLPWAIIDNAQTEPTDIYGIGGIPHIIVFAPDGKIAFRGLTGEKLAEEIGKLLD